MAIWQYTFQVLPKESVNTLAEDFSFNYTDEGFDDELFWENYPLKKGFFNKINSILEKTKSWSNDIDLYGNQESNCFEVLSDNEGNVLSVSFRLDFTSNYESILRHILEFCSLNGLVILDEGLNIVPLNHGQVLSVIRNSQQMKRYKELSEEDENYY
ncbi:MULTISPECIES: hypothetical protein [Flavobacterium]|uniref:Uncharacterized protein n=1 Tax=Flavobacterium supellecticarium TaxID=2565924 RepID=A0A4S3ZS56_9FLAO|nr:hypothetical protein [Flavobacterium supellecticarium]THF48480.1 hypothetical protein E6C50_14445 [Flavobacterium supellecticarium]